MKYQVVVFFAVAVAVAGASAFVATTPLAIASPPASTAPPVASPVPSPAPVPPRDQRVTYTYTTEMTIEGTGPNRRGAGAIDEGFGILELTFNGDGNITGTYRSDVEPAIRVTGSRIGLRELWVAIGVNRFAGRFTAGGLALTAPVFVPRSAPLAGYVWPNSNVDLVAAFLRAGPPAP